MVRRYTYCSVELLQSFHFMGRPVLVLCQGYRSLSLLHSRRRDRVLVLCLFNRHRCPLLLSKDSLSLDFLAGRGLLLRGFSGLSCSGRGYLRDLLVNLNFFNHWCHLLILLLPCVLLSRNRGKL